MLSVTATLVLRTFETAAGLQEKGDDTPVNSMRHSQRLFHFSVSLFD